MQKIGDITNTADPQGEFTDGNVAQGVTPTILPAAMFNTWQREMINVVEKAGIELDPENDAQLVEAIRSLITSWSSSNVKTVNSKSPDANGNVQISASDTGALPSGANAVSASKLLTARAIGGTAFDGTTNITPANCTTAAQATKLQTSRTIAGIGFDGTNNITIPAGNVGAYTKTEVDSRVNAKGPANSASKAANGWWKCGSTGVIIQWGIAASNGIGWRSVTLPIAFPSACVSAQMTYDKQANFGTYQGIARVDKTGLNIPTDNCNTNWIAIGY